MSTLFKSWISNFVVLPCAYLFNLSLTTGSVPECWKKKRVTSLFKKGNTEDPNNYRPISILLVIIKFSIVHRQVVDFLDSSNILSSFQSGFRNAHSKDTAVICVDWFHSYLTDRV